MQKGVCDAGSAPVFKSRRSEITLERARTAYAARDLDLAERTVLEIESSAGPLAARGLALRAWIAFQRNDHGGADGFGRAAIAHAATLPPGSARVQSSVLSMLATLAVERLDFSLWSFVEEHADRFDLTLPAFSELGHRLHWGRSTLYDANGQPEGALDSGRDVTRLAASEASSLLGRCYRAAVLLHYGERLAHRDLASSIRRKFESVDLAAIRDWTTAALPIAVAETLALMGDAEGAASALRKRRAIVNLPPSPYSQNRAWLAMNAYAEGVVADTSGGTLLAQRRFRQAFGTYRDIGFVRPAMIVALRLADMTGDAALCAYVDDHARGLSPRSWIRTKLAAHGLHQSDSVLQRLSRAEREILAHLVDGRSTADISAVRSRSPQTTRNTISKLYAAFGVGSRSALLREVARRRLVDADGAPTWALRGAHVDNGTTRLRP
jgi:DNA-binding CsgD family transcriptional regulator